jgi:MoaA/NifB/PqqE/SkfB family radical SAM enzyme
VIRPCDPIFSSIVHSFPSVIQVEPTNRCNFKCKICPRFSADYTQKNLDLNLNNFKLIMSNFPNISKVILYGRGEPFLNWEIFDMIKLLKDRDIIVSTLTNGSLLNPMINKQVIDSGIDDISFSIDSADPIINDKLRVGANLNSMLPNIKNLVKNGKNIRI